jgi:hypothetical protein
LNESFSLQKVESKLPIIAGRREIELPEAIENFSKMTEKSQTALQQKGLDSMERSIAMICKATGCGYAESCPVLKCVVDEDIPLLVGKSCPLEVVRIRKAYRDLSLSLNVNEEDETELMMLSALIQARIQVLRGAALESVRSPIYKKESIRSSSNSVETMVEEIIDPSIEISHKANDRFLKLMRAFVATREAKINANKVLANDPTINATRVREKFRAIVLQPQSE